MTAYVAQKDMVFLNGKDGKGEDGIAQDGETQSVSFKKGDVIWLEAILEDVPADITRQINEAVERGDFKPKEI